jgi:hypothetical protein
VAPATTGCRRREMLLVTDYAVVAKRSADSRPLAGRLDDGAVVEGLHGCDRMAERVDNGTAAEGCDGRRGLWRARQLIEMVAGIGIVGSEREYSGDVQGLFQTVFSLEVNPACLQDNL